jgi:type IV pilus assembly protein PilB
MMQRRLPIGEVLVGQGRIDMTQLTSALAYQRQWGGRLGHALTALGFVSEKTLLAALGEQLGVPFVEIGYRVVSKEVLKLLPEKVIRRHRVLPLALQTDSGRSRLLVALSEPGNLQHLDELAFAAGMRIRPVLAGESDIDQAIARHLDGRPDKRMAPIELPDEPEQRMLLVEPPHTSRTYH